MASPLLSIALTVEQHDEGDFFWVLLESFDRSMEFESLMESMHGFPTYAEALEAGVLAMKNLSPDPLLGPRGEESEDTESDDALRPAPVGRSRRCGRKSRRGG